MSRIDLYVSPGNCLTECAAQECVDFFNYLGGDGPGDILVAFQDDCGLIPQPVVINVQVMSGQILHEDIAQIWLYVVVDAVPGV